MSALLFIGIIGGTIALFVYTPALHKLIPGYKNPEEFAREREALEQKLVEMEEEVDRWITYSGSFKKLAGVEDENMPELSEASMDSMRNASEEGRIRLQEEAALEVMNEDNENTNQEEILTDQSKNSGQVKENVKVVYVPKSSTEGWKSANFPIMQNLFTPLSGEIRNPFNAEIAHYGVDIVAEENTLIHSVADGFVVMSEYSDDNGWVIGVASEENIVTFYKHNSRLLKDAGTYVLAGEPIAVIGNTGENSTGPHLHLELWRQGRPLDPTNYIRFN